MTRIAILGAGVVGLCSAVQLQDALPQARIKIIAADFDEGTTSFGSGGIFRIRKDFLDTQDQVKFKQYLTDASDFLKSKCFTAEGAEMGIFPVTLYDVFEEEMDPLPMARYCFSYHKMTPEHLQKFGPQFVCGFVSSTIAINNEKFMTYLKKRFLQRGGVCEKRKINKLSEIPTRDYDVIVNCTGLGSRWLFNDDKVFPVRGEVLKVEAPWIKYCLTAGHSTYMVQRPDYVIVGGTRYKDDYDLNPRDNEGILERVKKVCPNLEGCKVLQRWVGLRPHRHPIRIELEELPVDGKPTKIVHHYGHGPVGMCTSWGTTIEAVRLVKEALGIPAQSRL